MHNLKYVFEIKQPITVTVLITHRFKTQQCIFLYKIISIMVASLIETLFIKSIYSKIPVQDTLVVFCFNNNGINLNFVLCNKLYEPYIQNLCEAKGT